MSRLIPHPLMSLLLLGMWLLLTSFSLGNLVLGGVIALAAGRALGLIEPDPVRLRRPGLVVKLFFIVGYDIIRSNLAVAWLILSRGRGGRRSSSFVEIPLRLRQPAPLAILAMIVTATPGTAWIEYDTDTGILLLHVFDLLDDDDWRELIGNRYESLLMEIFP